MKDNHLPNARTRQDQAVREMQQAQWAKDEERAWMPLWVWGLIGLAIGAMILYGLPAVPA